MLNSNKDNSTNAFLQPVPGVQTVERGRKIYDEKKNEGETRGGRARKLGTRGEQTV